LESLLEALSSVDFVVASVSLQEWQEGSSTLVELLNFLGQNTRGHVRWVVLA
jgi:hypothetical protein